MYGDEQVNALSKVCAICEKVQILKTTDLCMACAQHAHEDAERDMPRIERWLEKHAAFEQWLSDHEDNE